MKTTWIYRPFKWLAWSIGALLLLIIALALLVQFRPVQNWLSQQAVAYLSNTLATDVKIGGVGLFIPSLVTLDEVQLNTPAGDTLVQFQHLGVGIDMWALTQRRVSIDKVNLDGLRAKIIQTDTGANFQFILDAFTSTDSTINRTPPPAASSSLGWNIQLSDLVLNITDSRFQYQDEINRLQLETEIGGLSLRGDTINLDDPAYLLDELRLTNSRIVFHASPTANVSADTTTATSTLLAGIKRLKLSQVSLDIAMDSLYVEGQVDDITAHNFRFRQGETLQAQLSELKATIPDLAYHQGKVILTNTFDPNHIALSDIQMVVPTFNYQDDSLNLTLSQLQLKERAGNWQIANLTGNCRYAPGWIWLENVQLNTPLSELSVAELDYELPQSSDQAWEALRVEARTNLQLSELFYFVPALRQESYFLTHPRAQVRAVLNAATRARILRIQELDINGPGIRFEAVGELANPLNMDAIRADLNIRELDIRPEELFSLLPPETLPSYIDWPERLSAQGELSYTGDGLTLDLQAQEEREEYPEWSFVRISGQLGGLTTYPNTKIEAGLDSVFVTRPTMQAYLPDSLLPAGYTLPSKLGASATFSGSLNHLELVIDLALADATTNISVDGSIQNLLNEKTLAIFLRIPELNVKQADIRPLLPDSLLPAMVNVPDLRIKDAELRGTLDSLYFSLPMGTTNGNWRVDGWYANDRINTDISIDGIRAADFFKGAIRDSLLSLELQPLRVDAHWEGQLSPRLQTIASAQLREKGRGQLLDLEAVLADTGYYANFEFDHPYFTGQGVVGYTPDDTLARTHGNLNLEKLDLLHWGLSNRALIASGGVEWKLRGLRADKLIGRVELDDLLLRGEGNTSYVDSLLFLADLQDGNNEVEISGDVLEGYLRGQFDPLAIADELSRFLSAYLRERPFAGEPVINGRRMDFKLRVKNPRPLTSGLIPGLTDLEPMMMELIYRDREPEFVFDLSAPHIEYLGLAAKGTKVTARGDERRIDFSANWQDLSYGPEIQLGPTRIDGNNEESGLAVALEVGPQDSLRYRLAATYQVDEAQTRLRLAPEQLVNYKIWQIDRDNYLSFGGDSLSLANWELRNEAQSLQLVREGEDLLLNFTNFPLGQWAKLLNPKQAIVSGQVNGQLAVAVPAQTPELRAALSVANLGIYGEPQGRLALDVEQLGNNRYTISSSLSGDWHELSVQGEYAGEEGLSLRLDAQKISLEPLAPFAQPFVDDPTGVLSGELALEGTFDAPRLEGQLNFSGVALTPSLLGSRLFIDGQSVRFMGENIRVEDFTLEDESDATLVMNGNVSLQSLTNPAFDLSARARNFLAVNSTASDNDLFYGYLRVNADLDISGRLNQPRLVITAEPTGDSRLTYAYSGSGAANVQNAQGVVSFAETYEWEEILTTGNKADSTASAATGAYIETNLTIDPSLFTTVIIDPLTQQSFSGRGEGSITFVQYPNGTQQLTGQVELSSGTYDMVLEGLQRYTFSIEEGSGVVFTGNPLNPQLDLSITNTVKASPQPLVEAFDPANSETNIRRRQTFEVALALEGDLTAMDITADIRYPDDAYGNQGYTAVEQALEELRRDQSRIYTTAITLITFKNFVLPLTDDSGVGSAQQGIVNGVAGAVGEALGNLLNQQLGFVDLDLGVDSYQTASGEENYNLRLSLQKSFFNDRLVISVDGVTNTASEQEDDGGRSYLDNISVAYLLDEEGNLKIKLFNDRDRNVFVGGNVIRFGGRLVFSKDFDRFFWQNKN